MTKTLFVGDIHGDTKALIRLTKYAMRLQKIERIIQVGDFSINPADYSFTWPFDIPLWFIPGNHDHYHALSRGMNLAPNVRYIKRGEIVDGILFVGGAYSVDKDLRVTGVDWFPEEQMSYREYIDGIDSLSKSLDARVTPEIKTMVCHDAPSVLYNDLGVTYDNESGNIYAAGLTWLVALVRPYLYIHGHHHKRMTTKALDCTFESLGTTSHYKTSRLKTMYQNCTVVCDI